MAHVTRTFQLGSALALLFALACDGGDPVTGSEAAPGDPKADRGDGPAFYEIDATRPLAASERKTVEAALAMLEDVAKNGTSGRQRALAGETLARIQGGDVRIGSIGSARGLDLWHICKDMEGQAACDGAPPDDPDWDGDEALRAALTDELDGYLWGDRLYFRFDATVEPKALASTIVHEVNHALNRSECSYYDDYYAHVVEPTLAWLEEYRSFVTECVLARGKNGTAARCDQAALAQLEEREYGFTPDLELLLEDPARGSKPIAESLFRDDGAFGWFMPSAVRWPSEFGECEPY